MLTLVAMGVGLPSTIGCYLHHGPAETGDADTARDGGDAGEDVSEWFPEPPPVRGTILLGAGHELIEIDRRGNELEHIAVPSEYSDGTNIGNVDVLQDGRIVLIQGLLPPEISIYDRDTGAWEHYGHEPWWAGNGLWQASGYGPFVFSLDESHRAAPGFHLVRLDLRTGGFEFIRIDAGSLEVGGDGLVYLARGRGEVTRMDPSTLHELETIEVRRADSSPPWLREFMVAPDGTIYHGHTRRWGDEWGVIAYRFDDHGREITTLRIDGIRSVVSVDVAPDGTVLFGTADGSLVITDAELEGSELIRIGDQPSPTAEFSYSMCFSDPLPHSP